MFSVCEVIHYEFICVAPYIKDESLLLNLQNLDCLMKTACHVVEISRKSS